MISSQVASVGFSFSFPLLSAQSREGSSTRQPFGRSGKGLVGSAWLDLARCETWRLKARIGRRSEKESRFVHQHCWFGLVWSRSMRRQTAKFKAGKCRPTWSWFPLLSSPPEPIKATDEQLSGSSSLLVILRRIIIIIIRIGLFIGLAWWRKLFKALPGELISWLARSKLRPACWLRLEPN